MNDLEFSGQIRAHWTTAKSAWDESRKQAALDLRFYSPRMMETMREAKLSPSRLPL